MFNPHQSNKSIFGYSGSYVTLQHLIETFGNENPRLRALLPQLYNDRTGLSRQIPVLQKDKNYYNTAIKKTQRKTTLSNAKNALRKPQLLKPNQVIDETLKLYGQLLREIFDEPSLLSPIFFDPQFKYLEPVVKLLTDAILANHFDSSHEHIFTHIMEDIMAFEFSVTEDLTTYLRENTAATKLLGAYLKREPVAQFVNQIVEEGCAHCLKIEKEDLEIDPNQIWEKEMNKINEKISYTGPKDPKIVKLCIQRREKLKKYIDFILGKIMNASKYPIGLRVVCKKLTQLARSRVPINDDQKKQWGTNNDRLVNSLIGGFIFLRIFNPKIAYYGKAKSQQFKKYEREVRRKFTLISKILQNISNQVRAGTKEKWMASMHEYIIGKREGVSNFFAELTDVPPLQSYFNLDSQILSNSSECESIYISIQDLKLLTTMICDERKKKSANKKPNKMGYKKQNLNDSKYYSLINQITTKKMFSMIPNDENASYYVVILIPKPSNVPTGGGGSGNHKEEDVRRLELKMRMKVIPVLGQLLRKDQLMAYLFELEPKDLVNDTINFLQFAQQNSNISNIQSAINVLKLYPNPKITKELLVKLHDASAIDTQILNRLETEVKKMKNYEQKLTREVKHLEVELERIKREQLDAARLAQQEHQKGKGKLAGFRDLAMGKISSSQPSKVHNKGKRDIIEQKQMETNVELTENIVAVDGMIGNMLLTLVKDVGQSMATNIKQGLKQGSKEYIDVWTRFPQNVPSYFPIIQRVARLGKMCMHELIYTIIEADKERRGLNEEKRFKFTVLKDHIKQFGSSAMNGQICQYVIDFMMVDVLQHCMKWITPSELYTTSMKGKYNMFHIEVNNKCIQKLQTIKHDKLGPELAANWSLKRLRKWGVLISIISPTYPECVVDNIKLLYNASPNDADGFLFGARYIKFHCDTNSVPTMQEYFDWIYSLIVRNQENSQRLKLIMLTLEHNIRSLTVNQDINNPVFIMKIHGECFQELYKVFATRGRRTGFRVDILQSPFRRLRSSLLLRSPGSINNHNDAADFLTSLANFKFAQNQNAQKASDLLHFLRGGGSSWDEAISRQNRTQSSAKHHHQMPRLDRQHTSYIPGYGGISNGGYPILEQAYGRIEPRLQLDSRLCKILSDKLFKRERKYDTKKQAVQIFMLSACAIQLCVHNFQYAITNIIQLFTRQDQHITIERIFIAVYALNFICLPECKFTEFMKHKIVGAYQHPNEQAANLAWSEMSKKLNEEKRKLHRQLKSLFEFLGSTKGMPIQKHLLSSDDARHNFSAEALQAQDEKLMFQEHVRKMLMFDWTDTPMERYMVPIQNIETELLIYCLRLAPHIECEELWEATEHNCSQSGTFIGKWLLHKDEKVREQVLRTLLAAMRDPSKRSAIMKCFIEMLLHHDWQTPACLTMLLKTVTHLLDHYRKLCVLDEESKKRHNMPRMGMYQQGMNMENDQKDIHGDNDPLRKGRELPAWFAWQNRADALGLVLLCHYNTQVRVHALDFLNKITDIYREFTGVGGGSVYIQKNTFAAMGIDKSKNRNISVMNRKGLGVRTVGGLIATHGRSIARRVTMKYDEEQQSDSKQNDSFRRSSTYVAPKTKVDFRGLIHQWGLIPFCISQLAKRVVNSHLHETILNVLDVLLYTLSFMPPHTAVSRDKTGWSEKPEWQGGHPIRGYWISLHTLFFSIVGAGLSNPFSVATTEDLADFKKDLVRLGHESYKLTRKQFEAYLNEFWFCLYEDSLWVKGAINTILQQTNWESIPIVLNSLNATYHKSKNSRKKTRKNIIGDAVYLLKHLAAIVKFPAGIYVGGQQIVDMVFGFINDVKLQAFTADHMQRKKWWETQTKLTEYYAYFLRGLSKIGAHNELRSEFWAFDFKQDKKNNKSINEMRKLWLQKKVHASAGPFKKDPMPHIKKSKTIDRFGMFKWLLQFLVDVDSIVTPFVDPNELHQQKQRNKKVRRAVFQGLQYLLNMGSVIPSHNLSKDGYIINLLRGRRGIDQAFEAHYSLHASSKNKCILQIFIEAETDKFQVLTPLLTFQFESLISFYIEQASIHPYAKQLFFRAIVNVVQANSNGGTMRLTAVESGYGKNNWMIARPRGNGFLESVFHYAHKLLFLGFIMIIENRADTRYSGYLLLRSMGDILVGEKLVSKIDKLKFAFESAMSLWVRKNGILISQYFAEAYPILGQLLFRVCIKYDMDKDKAEWISAFLKPWATVIHFKPDTIMETVPLYVQKYNKSMLSKNVSSISDSKEEEFKYEIPPSKAPLDSSNSHQRSDTVKVILGPKSSSVPSYDKKAQSVDIRQNRLPKTHQLSDFLTFNLLTGLFDSTVDAKDDLQTSFLKVWTDLSQAFPYDNLFAILDFVLKKVDEGKKLPVHTFKNSIMPTVKNIFFAIYEPALNRAIMTVYIVRIILHVLTIGAKDYRQKGLIVKKRAAEILSVLEQQLAREDNSSDNYTFSMHREILDYNIKANQSQTVNKPKINTGNNKPTKPNISNINNNRSGTKATNKIGSHKQKIKHKFEQLQRYRNTDDNNSSQPQSAANGGHKNKLPLPAKSNSNAQKEEAKLTPEEKRASIAAALLVELIGVDCEPIKPYFPVLVLYAALYIDKPSNHASMHNLLVRLIVTLSTNQTIREIEKNSHSVDDNKPSLAAALTSRTLELLWDGDMDDTKRERVSSKQFVHNQGDYVAIDGATFVREYCLQFESIQKAHLRTGYEALRWAVLSTNPEITTRSFHIYRQLLNPLNHCTVKVMLLALCGAIDNWKASESVLIKHSQSLVGHSQSRKSINAYAQNSDSSGTNINAIEFIETQRILDTIIRMAEKLKELGQIYDYVSFVWTGIALLRADVKSEKQKQVYTKGLELLNIVLDDTDITLQYLFVNQYSPLQQQRSNNSFMGNDRKRQSRPSVEFMPNTTVTPKGNSNSNNQYKHARFSGGTTQGGPTQSQSQSQQYAADMEQKHNYGNTRGGGNHAPVNSMTQMNASQWNSFADYKQSMTHNNNRDTPSLNPQTEPDWQVQISELNYDFEPDSFDEFGPNTFGHTLGGPMSSMDTNIGMGMGMGMGYDNNGQMSNYNNFGNEEMKYESIDDANNLNQNRMSYGQNVYDVYSNDLAESFLAYVIDWSPPFEGIYPYLLPGLLQSDIEDNTFKVLKKVLTTKMDKLAARSSARPCLCIVSLMPYLYYIIRYKPEYFATISHSLFQSLILLTTHGSNIYNNPYESLRVKFEVWSNRPIDAENVNDLLKEICTEIVDCFFNDHSGLVANYLSALLQSPSMIHHHTTVYKMAALFLNTDANYIQAFKDIIESAHKTVSEKVTTNTAQNIQSSHSSNNISLPFINGLDRLGLNLGTHIDDNESVRDYISEMADAATELVATGIDYLKAREKQRFTKHYNKGDFESTSGGPKHSQFNSNTPIGSSLIRWDVPIYDVTPFPKTGLEDVSNALWGVVKETSSL